MTEDKLYKWKCKCGKVIKSLHKGQFEYNKRLHQEACKKVKDGKE